MVKTAAVLPAIGIGDALLMMIASEQLKRSGYAVTTFHNALPELTSWFPGHILKHMPSENDLYSYDLILLENDNSPRVKHFIEQHRAQTSIFYPTYKVGKHAPLSPQDAVFNGKIPMAHNIAQAIATKLSTQPSKDNGLAPPATLIHRLFKNRVLIHPTSRLKEKNWKASGFIAVANTLKTWGLTPLFCVSPSEKNAWNNIEQKGLELVTPSSLSDLAALVYQSGFAMGNDSVLGHLASNLNIPTLIIANDPERMLLWQPGWLPGKLALPPSYLPKGLRKNYWQTFVTKRAVLRTFESLLGYI